MNRDSDYSETDKHPEDILENKQGKKIKYQINRRSSQMRKVSRSGQYEAKKLERKKSSIRSKIAHVFGVVEELLWYRKIRYRGLQNQTAKLNIMFALATLVLADRHCL